MKITNYWTKEWVSFNKDGIGGLHIFANKRTTALKKARELWGKGASVEFFGKAKITKIRYTKRR